MKKLVKSLLKLFIPLWLRNKIRALLNLPDQINVFQNQIDALSDLQEQQNKIRKQNDEIAYELQKIKILFLLKEQSPKLLHNFAAGIPNDNELINALSGSNIFYDLQNDFKSNMNAVLLKFICGVSELSLQKTLESQLNIAKNNLYKPQVFANILWVFMPHYADDKISSIVEQMYDPSFLETDSWGTIQYISFLLLRKQEAKALEVLRIYLKYYSVETLVEYILVADLAHRNGITSENISASAEFFRAIMKNVENRLLENYIESFGRGRVTVAIVGNGPHEIGLGKGAEIDAHDIVVRFNTFNDSEEYAKDYGKKTNINLHTLYNPIGIIFDRKIDVFICHSVYSERINMENIKRYNAKSFSNITTLELTPVRREIQEKYNVGWPTTGFRAIYYFKEVLKLNIRKSDIYGTALSSGRVMGGHYDNLNHFDVKAKQNHDLYLEYKALQDIFSEIYPSPTGSSKKYSSL